MFTTSPGRKNSKSLKNRVWTGWKQKDGCTKKNTKNKQSKFVSV